MKGWGEANLVQRECWVAWDCEVAVKRYVLDFFLCFSTERCSLALLSMPG